MSASAGAAAEPRASGNPATVVSVNGVCVAVDDPDEAAAAAARELLRQRAVALGLVDGGATEAAAVDAAIERLLEREVKIPEPTEAECRQYYGANAARFTSGDLAAVRHILFQVTPGTPVQALRAKAEVTLSELLKAPERFGDTARECSNCPSAQHGGNLGQIQHGDVVPEFAQALFDGAWTGIRPQLVTTRHGFHIVAVDHRAAGRTLPYDAVRAGIAERLRSHVLAQALRQYVHVLAGRADVRGVDLGGVGTPLVR